MWPFAGGHAASCAYRSVFILSAMHVLTQSARASMFLNELLALPCDQQVCRISSTGSTGGSEAAAAARGALTRRARRPVRRGAGRARACRAQAAEPRRWALPVARRRGLLIGEAAGQGQAHSRASDARHSSHRLRGLKPPRMPGLPSVERGPVRSQGSLRRRGPSRRAWACAARLAPDRAGATS